ncbi:MAG: hypothetical protein ABI376_05095, partial [Caulobacteraceae bacterium]
MTALINRRHEAFARARAEGASPRAAYAAAGYPAASRHWARIATRVDVVARAAQIARGRAWGGSRDLSPVIDEMMRMAFAAERLDSAAGLAAAKGFLVEAARLK